MEHDPIQQFDEWEFKPVCAWCQKTTQSTYTCRKTAEHAMKLLGWREGVCAECVEGVEEASDD